MKAIRRAYLYVIRKKGKSVLLFFILLTMATFVLTGFSIQKALQETQKNLREALGGEFYIAVELSESNPYFRMDDDGEGGFELYTELPITEDLINAVMETEGIEKYDASAQTLVSTNLTIFSGNVPLKGDLNQKVYARTVAGTENNSFFRSGVVELTEGEHITGKVYNAAVISRDLADSNNLKLGDVISLQADKEAEVRVIGIYEIRKPDPAFATIATYEKLENQIFIDTTALHNLFGDKTVGFYEAAFTVKDPARLDGIMSDVESLSDIDWRAFQVTADNQTYLDAVAPLQKLQALVSSIIWVIILVSAIILSLVLTMWGRSRIQETGVLLSLGIGKAGIIGQYLAEVLMIAVLAFGCSCFTSNAVTGRIADGLLQQDIPAKEGQLNDYVVFDVKEGYGDDVAEVEVSIDGAEADTEQISVTIGFYNMLQLYFTGIAVIVLSVGVSSMSVMRLKPREILSKMS